MSGQKKSEIELLQSLSGLSDKIRSKTLKIIDMKINISQIKDGEPKHTVLSDDLIERIKVLKSKLSEVERSPLEKTIDNFRYDRNPENEVRTWEEIADKYLSYINTFSIPPRIECKQEIFKILLMASCCSVDDEFLTSLAIVSKDEALYINSFFQNKNPITITRT